MQMKNLILPVFCALALAWTGCKKEDIKTPTEQIIPGQGLVDLKIGDVAQKAIDKYGSTVPARAVFNGQYVHYLKYSDQGVEVYCQETPLTTFDAQMKIKAFLFSKFFKGQTGEKIGIGSQKSAVKAAYGEPVFSSGGVEKYAIGINFFYDDAGETIEHIEVVQ